MNKNESKYFNTAVKMDKALLTLLEKRILSTFLSRKFVMKQVLIVQLSICTMKIQVTC